MGTKLMNKEKFKNISPFVRNIRVLQSSHLTGNWIDYDYVFTLIVKGEATFYIKGIKHILTQGNVILISPSQEHFIVSTGQEQLVQYIFHFDFFYCANRESLLWGQPYKEAMATHPTSQQELDMVSEQCIKYHLCDEYFLEVQSIFLKMQSYFTDKVGYYETHMKYLCIQILLACIKSNGKETLVYNKSNTKVQVNVQKAIKFIRRNYDNPKLNNEMIAHNLEITPKYLSYIFNKVLGINIHKYITQIRIEAAQQFMILERFNITEIAYAVGYTSIHSFSKTFKNTTGISPSEFLKNFLTSPEQVNVTTSTVL